MQSKVEQLRRSFEQSLEKTQNSEEAYQLQVQYLGRKGPIQALMSDLKGLSSEERPLAGEMINNLKSFCLTQSEKRLHELRRGERTSKMASEKIDVTEPGRLLHRGSVHPVTQMMEEMLEIFVSMGFSVQYGPDIDSDWYNFGALNYPEDHPARDMQDTFYLNPEMLLRSHTSNTQLHVMENHRPPIRIVAPGTTYRNETISARSHVFFHQIEGIYIAEHVTFTDLIGTMNDFLSKLFKQSVETRFRPSFFPFVEPGVEVDVRCTACRGSGCRLCKRTGWLEVVGAGMIHPVVLQNGKIDPEKYSGYAWGFGVERLALLRYGIPDIRMLFENDARFLQQF